MTGSLGLDFECATLGEFALSAGGLAENVFAVIAGNYDLGVTENGGGLVASSALDVHEIAVVGGHQSFQFMGVLLVLQGGVKQISLHCGNNQLNIILIK